MERCGRAVELAGHFAEKGSRLAVSDAGASAILCKGCLLYTSSIILAIFVILAYSMFISGLCIAVAGRSKTFKEAQSALTPLIFISFFPGMIAFMMGVTGSPLLSIVPFLNFVVVFTDVNNGSVELLDILLMLVSTGAYIAAVLTYVIKQYKSEKVLFAK